MSIGILTLQEALAELNNPANAIKYSTIEGLESMVKQVSAQDTMAGANARHILFETIYNRIINLKKEFETMAFVNETIPEADKKI